MSFPSQAGFTAADASLSGLSQKVQVLSDTVQVQMFPPLPFLSFIIVILSPPQVLPLQFLGSINGLLDIIAALLVDSASYLTDAESVFTSIFSLKLKLCSRTK